MDVKKSTGMFSSVDDTWGTPQALYDELNEEFGFTSDVCASDWNAKHENYWTILDDCLSKSWKGHVAFMNPPYGKEIADFVQKAKEEHLKHGTVGVAVLPARTDTRWFHLNVYDYAHIEFIRGRLKFERNPALGITPGTAPFPTMIAVWGMEVVE